MNIGKIKDRFSRIFKQKKIGPRKPEILEKIYEVIKKSKEPLRIKEIVDETGLKETIVRTYLKYLEQNHYIQKTRKYSPPFLLVEAYKSNPEFIYGQENRDRRTQEEKNKLLEEVQEIDLGEEYKNKVKVLRNSRKYDSKLLKIHNELIELLWRNKIFDVSRINIGSAANRYKI